MECLLLVGKMPTSCCVVGCSNRHSTSSNLNFYRFLKDNDRRRMWFAFVCRQNHDGTPWEPDDGDRLCSQHFLSGSKSDLPTDPDYVPSVNPGKENAHSGSGSSVARFQRAQRHSRAAFTEMVEAEATDQHHKLLLSAVIHDHGTLAKTGSECCLDREGLIVKPPSHSELMEVGERDKIISVDIGMFHNLC